MYAVGVPSPGLLLRRHIGANTRRIRVKHGWTQADLALAVGREMLTIQRWEAGAQGTIDALAEIAQALGVSPGSLCRPAKLVVRRAGRPRKKLAKR